MSREPDRPAMRATLSKKCSKCHAKRKKYFIRRKHKIRSGKTVGVKGGGKERLIQRKMKVGPAFRSRSITDLQALKARPAGKSNSGSVRMHMADNTKQGRDYLCELWKTGARADRF